MGLQIMKLPELESTDTSRDASGRILTVHPVAFLPPFPESALDLIAYLPLGLEYDESPPEMVIQFPHTSHLPIGTPIVFDVFLRPEVYFSSISSSGYTVNRYQLDVRTLGCEIAQDPVQTECSLAILETFSFIDEPTSIFRFPHPRYINHINPANPLDVTGLVEVERSFTQRRNMGPRMPSGFTAYSVVPHKYSSIPSPDSERAKAWAHMGSAELDRPTTASVLLLTLYNHAGDRTITDRALCGTTGRIVAKVMMFSENRDEQNLLPIFPSLFDGHEYAYVVWDYVHR